MLRKFRFWIRKCLCRPFFIGQLFVGPFAALLAFVLNKKTQSWRANVKGGGTWRPVSGSVGLVPSLKLTWRKGKEKRHVKFLFIFSFVWRDQPCCLVSFIFYFKEFFNIWVVCCFAVIFKLVTRFFSRVKKKKGDHRRFFFCLFAYLRSTRSSFFYFYCCVCVCVYHIWGYLHKRKEMKCVNASKMSARFGI